MKLGWSNVLGGIGVAVALLGKAAFARKPVALDLQQRLAMLPLKNAPTTAAVTIRWNDRQVPFIEAAHDVDLMVALGVVHAHLRLGQIEVMRRIAYGRVAEMIGPLGVEVDRSLRLFDFGRAVPAMLDSMGQEDRQLAEGFVAGINHVLLDGGEKPAEFKLLGFNVEPWTLSDLLTVGRLAAADISWLVWMRLLPQRERLAPAVWSALWSRLLTGGMPSSLAAQERNLGERALAAMLRSGSNSAAVAARRTRSGAAMIASDPHLPLGLPNPWLIVGMHSPGFHCVGVMMPALPFMLLGRNRWIAWGATSLHAQASDLYDVSAQSVEAIRTRTVTVRARGARSRRLRLRESEFGPIVSDGPLLSSKQPLALRWMGHQPSHEIGAMLGVARARDWGSFQQALRGYGVSGINVVFAGNDGRVAHVLAAHLPKRTHEAPDDLVLQPSAAKHWHQVADTMGMPVRLDPPEGFVASANERPRCGDFPVGYFFAPPARGERLAALLSGPQPLDMDDLRLVQRDVIGPGSLRLRDALLAAWPRSPRHAGQQRLQDALNYWNGDYSEDSIGALAFELLLAGVAGRLNDKRLLRAYQTVWMTQSLLLEDFAALPEETLRKAIEQALPLAVKQLKKHVRWGDAHRIRLKHPLGYLPGFARFFNAPAFASGGGNNTVHKTGHLLHTGRHEASFGSCARHISDLSDLDANDFVLLGGQDGWAGSANYLDQIKLWQRGEYIRVPLRLKSVQSAFAHVTVLTPASSPEPSPGH
ncbi:penicillin acylase family protein [Dyella tabacisoli]|uniref:Penicillin acylase family protein n=1 Tax=Dyella tabacisoli TaxID=2282381 RepID=A0A369UQN1_9GAMM|nr:penicillin acylase family protein [Dyella tabacisoli]RDD82777.1 penicillin acylase family protein [Dyella tabacisoli]